MSPAARQQQTLTTHTSSHKLYHPKPLLPSAACPVLPPKILHIFLIPAFSANSEQNPAPTPHIVGGHVFSSLLAFAPVTLFDNRIPHPTTPASAAVRATSHARPMLRASVPQPARYRSEPLFPRAALGATCCAPPAPNAIDLTQRPKICAPNLSTFVPSVMQITLITGLRALTCAPSAVPLARLPNDQSPLHRDYAA